MLGSHDYIVVVRRWRQRGPVRHASPWEPAGIAGDAAVAAAMAELAAAEPLREARVLTRASLLKELRSEDRERILDRLGNPTKGDLARAAELRRLALAKLAQGERRSGRDRRSGGDRRRTTASVPESDRRSGRERRSGLDRRATALH